MELLIQNHLTELLLHLQSGKRVSGERQEGGRSAQSVGSVGSGQRLANTT
jgi:hypothetical protein